MIPGNFAYHAPTSVDEAVGLLAELGEDARPLAGGHSLIPMMKLRLAPLEHLFERGRSQIRVAVLRAARQLYFKRTFVAINKGVADRDAAVRRTSQEAIAALHFPHAFDPLSRLQGITFGVDVGVLLPESGGEVPQVELDAEGDPVEPLDPEVAGVALIVGARGSIDSQGTLRLDVAHLAAAAADLFHVSASGASRIEGLTCASPPNLAIMAAISAARRLSNEATRSPVSCEFTLVMVFMLITAGGGR